MLRPHLVLGLGIGIAHRAPTVITPFTAGDQLVDMGK